MKNIIRAILSAAVFAFIGLFAASVAEEANAHSCPLCGPAVAGDILKLNELLVAGADPNMRTAYNATPLFYAVRNRNGVSESIVETLISAGADVNAADSRGFTPMFVAAIVNNPLMVTVLFHLGGRADARSTNGWTPLTFAARYGHDDVLDFLLAEANFPTGGVQDLQFNGPNRVSAGSLATIGGHSDLVKRLRENEPSLVNFAGNNDGVHLMHFAAYLGRQDIAEYFDGHFSWVQDKDGRTPLHYAASLRDNDMYSYLVARNIRRLILGEGLDGNQIHDNQGYVPLDYLDNPQFEAGAIDPPLAAARQTYNFALPQ